MPTKNLGQVSAIIISSTEPSTPYVLWFDLSNNSVKFFNFGTSTWDTLSGQSSLGQIKLNSSDSVGYLADKINSSLTISGGSLGVANPVTAAEKLKWNGQATTYFVLTHAALAGLTANTGDQAIVADDGAGTRAGYYWTGSAWLKDFDPNWENVNLHWANIVDVPAATTLLSGVLKLALDADITAGTDTTKAVTPKQLNDKIVGLSLGNASQKTVGIVAANVPEVQTTLVAGQIVKVGSTGLIGGLFEKVMSIGSWNMNTDQSIIIDTGISENKLVDVSIVIFNDGGNAFSLYYANVSAIPITQAGQWRSISPTSIQILRNASTFQGISFSDTSVNRGYMTIKYVA